MPHGVKNTEDDFWGYIAKQPNGCWLWTGYTSHGYGFFYTDGRRSAAHRFSWKMHFGCIPTGLCVLHKCDVSRCVNPKHLFLGTRGDNNRDAQMKGRLKGRTNHPTSYVGELRSNSKLTSEEVTEIRDDLSREDHMTLSQLAETYGVSMSTIWKIKHRRKWAAIWGQKRGI